jgi:heptosyltransferase-2
MKILIVQNKKGIGDLIIFLPFIEALAKKFETQVYLLVKENSKALDIVEDNKYIKEIILLDRDNQSNDGIHEGVFGTFRLIKKLKKYKFDKIFIFNSSLRFNLIAKLCYIKDVYQYPLFFKKNQNITLAAQKLLESKMGIKVKSDPQILVDEKKINSIKISNNISSNEKNILLGIGGSGSTKRIPAKTFLKFMDYCDENYKCRFFLATGKLHEEQIILDEILNSKFKQKCIRLDNLRLKETLPYIKNCNISICNDSSFSHLSAALGIPTIVLMADTPIIYGSYSPRMHPILPDGVKEVKHDTLGKDKINAQKIYEKFEFLIS